MRELSWQTRISRTVSLLSLLLMEESLGGRFTSYIYRSDDGITVEHMIEVYRAVEAARDRMGDLLGSATRVIERLAKPDALGRQVTERAVYEFTERGETLFADIWIDGSTVHSVRSKSLPHIRAIENKCTR